MREEDNREHAKATAGEAPKEIAVSKATTLRSDAVVGSPAQESEALLVPVKTDKPKRYRSGSYGSRQDHDTATYVLALRQGKVPTDGAEYEVGGEAQADQATETGGGTTQDKNGKGVRKDGTTLAMAFIIMIFVGTGNRVFMKLQTYPMYNYPFFLTMLTTFIYIPVCFTYIIPMLAFGSSITPEQRAIPKHKFAVMGFLDSVAGIMGVFAVNYISNAAVIVLLQQAAIPISMLISKLFLGARYSLSQYMGASVVIAGIIVSLIPTLFGHHKGGDDLDASTQIMWSTVQVLSCIPMCLSSVYKEKVLGDGDMDVIYLNGWVAVFQFLASLILAVPSAYAIGLPITELPRNSYQGYRCFLGIDSQVTNMAANVAVMPPDHCRTAPLLVTFYLCFNLAYNVVLIVILKYGSANVLFLASTVMVPIGNVAFSLKFVPHHQDLRLSDIMGLLFILTGLVVYRFSVPILSLFQGAPEKGTVELESDEQTGRRMSKYVGINQLEYLEPLMQTRFLQAQKANLLRSPEQIRASFLHRLGLPPSPLVSATPTSRGSPYLARGASGGGNPPRSLSSTAYRASSGTRASPSARVSTSARESPSTRASPGARASPGNQGGYRSIGGSYRSLTPGRPSSQRRKTLGDEV